MSDIIDLAGRVAFVTGAGQGVGRQIALQLAAHNAGGVAGFANGVRRSDSVKPWPHLRSCGRRACGMLISLSRNVTRMHASIYTDHASAFFIS